jgi:ketosteroid isomerase-like protein
MEDAGKRRIRETRREKSMGIAERYRAYADAFEESYIDNDWSRIEEFFTEGAVYEGEPGPDAEGRDAVLAKLQGGVDAFDRRMDSRSPDFQTPTVDGNVLTMKWSVSYAKAGAPDLVLSGSETAVFEGDRIARLRDDFDPIAQKTMGEWMAKHGDKLGA